MDNAQTSELAAVLADAQRKESLTDWEPGDFEQPPLRLLLGRDVLKAMRDKIAAMSASIEEWKAVTKDVNFLE